MTEDEARKVLRIMVSADGYCRVCAGNLCQRFTDTYPQFAPLADEALHKMDDYKDEERARLDEEMTADG